jgi:hypothetical protein
LTRNALVRQKARLEGGGEQSPPNFNPLLSEIADPEQRPGIAKADLAY